MTSLGFPGLSSQSVSRFFGLFRPENPETDWDDKPGLPRVVIPVHFGFFVPFSAENPETDRFGFLWALFGLKTPKRIGRTSLGFPGLSSQSVSGFFGPFRPENPETDWVSPGCHPSPFQGCLALFGQKTPKRTGMTNLGFPGLSSQSVSGFLCPFRPENPETD